jgi:flagellar assembly protein FliH
MMHMSSKFNLQPSDVNSSAQTYVYPHPLVADAAAKPAVAVGSSTLERLWGPELKPPAPPVSEDQIRAREARARKEGRDEGLAQGHAEVDKKLAAEKQVLGQAVREFARESEAYFHRVEGEVVNLALAIARKILHREAQVDPLLLAGVVRVGLDKLARGTRVRLRVAPDQTKTWQQFFAQQEGLQASPELVGDASLGTGHCMLETELGSTDLTLESQMKEIEQGFFDLLALRPQ